MLQNNGLNMGNGLNIKEDQFVSLTLKEQNMILLRNLIEIKKNFKGYTFHKKMIYGWLSVLTAFTGLKRFIGL